MMRLASRGTDMSTCGCARVKAVNNAAQSGKASAVQVHGHECQRGRAVGAGKAERKARQRLVAGSQLRRCRFRDFRQPGLAYGSNAVVGILDEGWRAWRHRALTSPFLTARDVKSPFWCAAGRMSTRLTVPLAANRRSKVATC